MMDTLFNRFQDLVATRFQYHGSFKAFGEDSIRYDFYAALQQVYGLLPHQIILEQAIPSTQFEQTKRDPESRKQGRQTDKPEFDLRVDPSGALDHGIIAEFAFFRTPEIGKVDTTGAYGKILNEIHRLALLKHYRNTENNALYKDFSSYKCLLICVTDSVMLNYGNGARGRKPSVLIQNEFNLCQNFLSPLTSTIKEKIQPRFSQKVSNFQITPTASRIINMTTPEWGIWAWEVDFEEL